MTEEEANKLRAEMAQVRRAYTDLFNRVTFTEKRVDTNSDYVLRKQGEEIQAAVVAQNQEHHVEQKGKLVITTELVPYVEDINKLPAKYSDKTFPF